MLESILGKKAVLELLPAQPGDAPETCADIERARAAIGFTPKVALEDGLREFVSWFKHYYGH
jgi:UDP-glucuronate 4-epimerase